MEEETEQGPVLKKKQMLSTGSTLLNLACTGRPFGGFIKGFYYWFVGDSDSGKTFFTMAEFAEATLNENFKGYRFIYDNIEYGMQMDLDKLFNEEVADRMEPPQTRGGSPVYSATIEEFYFNVDDAVKAGKPFIYVLDSMDGLDSEAADKKFQTRKRAHRKKTDGRQQDRERGEEEEKVAGSYGDGKARINSEGLRKLVKGLQETGSILIIISQIRDTFNSYGGSKKPSGGWALAFYATLQIWTSVAQKIRKEINGKQRDIGSRIKIDVKRNRLTGKRTSIEVDIFPSSGIDDIGSCIDYLTEEGFWPMAKQTITATGLGLAGTREKLIRAIEKDNMEHKLRKLCGQCWADIDAKCAVQRKNRYTKDEA